MRRFAWWFASLFDIQNECHKLGYDWGWRAARANPDATSPYVPCPKVN